MNENPERKTLFGGDYNFYGENQTKVIKLCSCIDEESKSFIFKEYIELFVLAPLVGLKHDLKGTASLSRDRASKAAIALSTLKGHSSDVKLVFACVMLLGNQDKYDKNQRIEKAFLNPDTSQNLEEFEEYLFGGIDYLYSKFFDNGTLFGFDEYYSQMIDLLSEVSDRNISI